MAQKILVYQQFFLSPSSLSHAHFQFSASITIAAAALNFQALKSSCTAVAHKISIKFLIFLLYLIFHSQKPFIANGEDEKSDFWKEFEGSDESDAGKVLNFADYTKKINAFSS